MISVPFIWCVFQFFYNKKFLSKLPVTLINGNHLPSSKLSKITGLNEFPLFWFEPLSLIVPRRLFGVKDPPSISVTQVSGHLMDPLCPPALCVHPQPPGVLRSPPAETYRWPSASSFPILCSLLSTPVAFLCRYHASPMTSSTGRKKRRLHSDRHSDKHYSWPHSVGFVVILFCF